MAIEFRAFVDHHVQVQDFVVDAVGLIMQRLNEQTGRQVRCVYSNDGIRSRLLDVLEPLSDRYDIDAEQIADEFASRGIDQIVAACEKDAQRYPTQDPALENLEEVFYASNGFWATVAYRLAHALVHLGVPVIPRSISGVAHSRTGVDIHPAASIAPGLFIDHGTGIAIGCTAVIEEDVNLYNGVVLGTRSKPKKRTDGNSGNTKKRHPTIRRDVSLYTNAFVGGDVEIGSGASIGAYAFVCRDVEPGSVVLGKTDEPKPEAPRQLDPISIARPAANPSVLDLIGNTPVVRIRRVPHNPQVKIIAKLEGSNPSGSIKDRIALSLIEEGERSGALTWDKTILESTSGNTGIGLAMVGAAKGYRVVLTMSSAMSEERKQVLRAFGAELIETDPEKGTGGAIERARQMVREEPGRYWLANQHSSANNPKAHYEGTAAEILQQVPDVTHFVAGIGTFGTLKGAGGRLREEVGATVVGLEPALGKPIQGLRNMNEPFAPELYDETFLDHKITVLPEDAMRMTREIAMQEGLFVGMSSGAALDGAIQLAETLDEGVIVAIFPDRGEKYLSTPLFAASDQANVTTSPIPLASAISLGNVEPQFAYMI